MKPTVLQGVCFLILAQTMVATNIVVSKVLLISIPIVIVLAIRFLLASLVLLPLHWFTAASQQSLKTHFLKLGRKDWLFIIAQALSAGVLFNALMLIGLNRTDANVAGIITSALPAIIALMSWMILGEKISVQKLFCIFFATLGLAIIASDQFTGLTASHSFSGDMIVFLSLFPEAMYYILCKLHSNQLPLFLISSLLNGINALLFLPVLLLTQWNPTTISGVNWGILLITGLGSGLFYVFWFVGSQRVDAVMASLTTAIMPVMTVIIAWAILQEQLTIMESTGMALIICSIALYARK